MAMIDIGEKIGVIVDSSPFVIVLHDPWCAKTDPGEPHAMFASTISDAEREQEKLDAVALEKIETEINEINSGDLDARAEKLNGATPDYLESEEAMEVLRLAIRRSELIVSRDVLRSAIEGRKKEASRYSFIKHKCTKKPSGWPGEPERPMSFEESVLLAMKRDKR